MEYFLIVGKQVLIMALLMALGYLVYKGKLLDDEGARQISNFLLKITVPASIIFSFLREYDGKLMAALGISAALAAVCHLLPIGLGALCFPSSAKSFEDKRNCLVFSNNGFMALPLLQALLGETGVFLGSAHIVVSNVLLWTYGLFTLTRDRRNVSLRKAFINPGIIGVAIGLLVFICPIPIPDILVEPLRYVNGLNTPLAMVVCGIYMAQAGVLSCLKGPAVYWLAFLKLLAVPAITLLLFSFLPVGAEIKMTLMVAVCCPTAAAAVMFAHAYGSDVGYCTRAFALTTLLSMASLPVVLTVAQTLFS